MDRGPVDSKGVRRSWRDALFRRDPLNPRRRHEVSRRRPVQVVVLGFVAGITAQLAVNHQLTLAALMFIGRLGPVTLGSALAMRGREPSIRYPETSITIG